MRERGHFQSACPEQRRVLVVGMQIHHTHATHTLHHSHIEPQSDFIATEDDFPINDHGHPGREGVTTCVMAMHIKSYSFRFWGFFFSPLRKCKN